MSAKVSLSAKKCATPMLIPAPIKQKSKILFKQNDMEMAVSCIKQQSEWESRKVVNASLMSREELIKTYWDRDKAMNRALAFIIAAGLCREYESFRKSFQLY